MYSLPGTVLRALHILTRLASLQSPEGTAAITFILWTMGTRHREVNKASSTTQLGRGKAGVQTQAI